VLVSALLRSDPGRSRLRVLGVDLTAWRSSWCWWLDRGRISACQPLPALLRPNKGVNAARLAGSALPSCSPPASARPRSPASWGSPAKASATGMPAGRLVARCPAQPRADRPDPTAVGPSARPGRTGPAEGRHRQRVHRGAVDPGPHHAGHRGADRRAPPSRARVGAVAPSPRLEVQRPVRRAAERDQVAVNRWVKECWPAIKQTPTGQSLPGLLR
jgi:hypothetical protein